MSENKKLIPKRRFKEFQNTDAWEQRELGEVADIVGGGTPSTSVKEFWDGNIDWYSPVEIGDKVFVNGSQKKITDLGFQKSSAQMLPAGTVLFTSRAGIGSTAILEKEACTNQGFQSVVPKENLDTYFIYSRSHELKRYGEITGAGSTFVEVSGKQMAKMPILIPNIKEQREIGNFFNNLDKTIAFQQRKLEKMKSMKSAYLSEMFPAAGERKPKRRFPGFTDDWEPRELGEVADIFDGTHQTPKYMGSGIKFVSVENIDTLDTEKYISEEAYNKEYSNKQAEKGDVLMTRIGDIGTAKVIETNDSLAYYVTLALLKPKGLDSYFLSNAIATPTVQNSIWRRTLHIAFPKKINLGEINQVELFVPTIDEQIKIGELFQNLDQTIAFQQQKLEKLQNIKKAYLNEMFI